MRIARNVVIAVVGIVVTIAIVLMIMPKPPNLSAQVSGDPELIKQVRELLDRSPGPRDRVSVIVKENGYTREAHFGANRDTEYEIGSVTKTMTGSLLAVAIERGEVEADTKLGEVFDLGDSPAADVTMIELATHSSGLPRLGWSVAGDLVYAVTAAYRPIDPYADTDLAELLNDAHRADVGEKKYEYSNLGFALLGQALATVAGVDYSTLLAERIFTPLGMQNSYSPRSRNDLAPTAPTGFNELGIRADPWTMGAYGPAGNVRSTAADLAKYLSAQLDQTAPGIAATAPIRSADAEDQIGYGWMATDSVTWHNGATGGFTSWIGFDPRDRKAAIVLNSSAANEGGLMLFS